MSSVALELPPPPLEADRAAYSTNRKREIDVVRSESEEELLESGK
jgi:hypothetical protein